MYFYNWCLLKSTQITGGVRKGIWPKQPQSSGNFSICRKNLPKNLNKVWMTLRGIFHLKKNKSKVTSPLGYSAQLQNLMKTCGSKYAHVNDTFLFFTENDFSNLKTDRHRFRTTCSSCIKLEMMSFLQILRNYVYKKIVLLMSNPLTQQINLTCQCLSCAELRPSIYNVMQQKGHKSCTFSPKRQRRQDRSSSRIMQCSIVRIVELYFKQTVERPEHRLFPRRTSQTARMSRGVKWPNAQWCTCKQTELHNISTVPLSA